MGKSGVVWADRGDGSVQLATRISRELHKRVKIEAFKCEVKLSEWVTEALTAHLARCKAEKPAATPTR